MNRIRVYIDTSVIGGYFDEEFEEDTRLFFERVDSKELILIISDLLEIELLKAPVNVREVLNKYSEEFFERINLTEEVIELADSYLSEGIVGKSSIEDCRHIALATINKVDVLVSWNFRHVVNLDKIKGYNSINLKKGYSIIEIRSPKELIKNEY